MVQSSLQILRIIQDQAQNKVFLLNIVKILQMILAGAGLRCIGYHWIYMYPDVPKRVLILLVLFFCGFVCFGFFCLIG